MTPYEIQRLKEWLQQLPKVLWEVGMSNPSLTEVGPSYHVAPGLTVL